ncbi:MAG TPA: HAMP domain-containing protein, partial [Anaerolineaceae bacterium]|nr:HAMP domain-containing protein [Anaerolineaceae bacterium]
MFRKIRWRIALPYILLILLLMLGLQIYLSNTIEKTYLADLESQLTVDARAVAEIVQPSWGDPAALRPLVAHWAAVLNARLTLIDVYGNVIGDSAENLQTMDNHSTRPEVISALKDGQGSSIRFSHTLGVDMLYTAVRLGDPSAPLGVVRLARPISQIQARLDQIRQTLWTALLAVTLAAGLLAVWIASITSRPVERLTRAANQIAAGDFSLPTLNTSVTELELLIKSFNQMALQIRSQVSDLEAERGKLAAVLDHM